MRVLVIGGAGYIGSHVALELVQAGYEVTVFDNLSTGTRTNLVPGARFVAGDLHDRGALFGAVASVDAVVHLAAKKAAGESMIRPELYATANIAGSIEVLNAMVDAQTRYIVFSSSAAVYGMPQYLPIDEKHPQEPMNFYGATKLHIEGLLRWYSSLRGVRYAALRYFNAAGYDPEGRILGLERNPANLLPVVMEAAVGIRDRLTIFGDDYETRDGTGVRDYVHVSDLARAHRLALDRIAATDDDLVVNLGSEAGFTVREILSAAEKVVGREIPVSVGPRRPGDPAELVASSALAREILGWKAQYSDAETLVESTWNVYRRENERRGNERHEHAKQAN